MLINKREHQLTDQAKTDTNESVKQLLQVTNLHKLNQRNVLSNSKAATDKVAAYTRFSKTSLDQRRGQFRTLFFLSVLIFCFISTNLVKANSMHNASLQTGIAEDIIRFHVIANSDSEEDQALKLKVKDALVQSLSPLLRDAATKEDARAILQDKMSYIQATAKEVIKQNGYTYPVAVSLADCYFPLKIYGEYTFPAGIYEALRVQIGSAQGKNWWCVMFPPLCFVDETYSIVDENSGDKLKHVLTEEEYDSLVKQKKPVKIKFKLWESLKELFA